MSKNQVVVHLGATSSGGHGAAASEQKISLAAELARGLNETKRQTWTRGEGHARQERNA